MAVATNIPPIGSYPGLARAQSFITRTQLFAAVFIVGWANRLLPLCWDYIRNHLLETAIFNLFGISVIVWMALFCGLLLLLTDDQERPSLLDFSAALSVLAYFLLPVREIFSAVPLTLLALYVILGSRPGSNPRRGSTILLALAVPLFWSKLLFVLVGKPLLLIDAFVVAMVTGSERLGNVIGFTDGSGYFQVMAPCSSVHNMSLAFLASVTLSETVTHRGVKYPVIWTALACFSVVAINMARLSLLGFFPKYFNQIHGEPGAGIAAMLSLVSIAGILLFGFRREIFART